MNSFVSNIMCGRFVYIITDNGSAPLCEYTSIYLPVLLLMSLWLVSDIWHYEHFFCSYYFCDYSKQV